MGHFTTVFVFRNYYGSLLRGFYNSWLFSEKIPFFHKGGREWKEVSGKIFIKFLWDKFGCGPWRAETACVTSWNVLSTDVLISCSTARQHGSR